MFNAEMRNNIGNKRFIERISNRRERFKETSKATFDGFQINERKRIFQFTREIRSYNRFSNNHANDSITKRFKMRFRKRKF